MELSEILYQKTNDVLKHYIFLLGGCPGATRKDELVRCIHRALMTPESLQEVWAQLDNLSQKAVAAAFHNGGEFNPVAFVAQYGQLPERPQTKWYWQRQPILLDVFIYERLLPADLMPLLEVLVPPPERFEVQGLTQAPKVLRTSSGESVTLACAETEQAGLHDLMATLRLINEGQIAISTKTSRVTTGSIRKIVKRLLDGDFFPLPDSYRSTDTIRPYGLEVFIQEAGLAKKARGRSELELTQAGQAYFQTQDPEILLDAFETWTQHGEFDELSRISSIKGQKSKQTTLTQPGTRREAIIEALSWCPVDVWIKIEDFYRALKIWHFDFPVETDQFTNLYIGDREHGTLYGETYWAIIKGLYVKAVLWEYLGVLGGLDLLYTSPEEADLQINSDYVYYDGVSLSPYDGLKYIRINNLGAYLLGQAAEYAPGYRTDPTLFTISADLRITIMRPEGLTPNDQYLLEQVAAPLKNGRYRLNMQRLLTSLEAGHELDHLTDFLKSRNLGPLPSSVFNWIARASRNSQAFKSAGPGLLIKVETADLAEMVMSDSVLRRFCKRVDQKTLVIPANKEQAFRSRLKALEYLLL